MVRWTRSGSNRRRPKAIMSNRKEDIAVRKLSFQKRCHGGFRSVTLLGAINSSIVPLGRDAAAHQALALGCFSN